MAPGAAPLLTSPSPAHGRPVLLVVAEPSDLPMYAAASCTQVAARTTTEALHVIARSRPQVVVIDWDIHRLDGPTLCQAGRAAACLLLATTAQPERAPQLLKAGCHSVLLKPFAPNLMATRLGRLLRDMPTDGATVPPRAGTVCVWPDERCPTCGVVGPMSFEFFSHRRAWYACLSCDSVWLDRRREE